MQHDLLFRPIHSVGGNGIRGSAKLLFRIMVVDGAMHADIV